MLISLVALLTGVMGWTLTPFVNAIIWIGKWHDGDQIDWGGEVAWTVAVPFVWVFAIVEIILVYKIG